MQTPQLHRQDLTGSSPEAAISGSLKADILRHIRFTLGRDPDRPNAYTCFMGLAYSLRDRMIDRWIASQRALYDTMAKRVYFLSLEFLPGRFLKNYLISLQLEEEARSALHDLGFDLDELEEEEWDAGLGNGGLGRLASCYMDSLACSNLPAYGYGIRYDYGIFFQVIEDGYQREQNDNWSRRGNPWEIRRRQYMYPIRFYGRSESYTDTTGHLRFRWEGGEVVMAMACDILVPGYGDNYVTNMRLWAARSSREFELSYFNKGDFVGAVQAKVLSENISKVLYPSDAQEAGRELRLKQQYFFVAATLMDILRRFRKQGHSFEELPNFAAIQLNDTHPAIAIAELMRLLIDEEGLGWDEAWPICEEIFAFTNHTVLPEALETWTVELLGRLLPRHLEIIYEINRRFLETVRRRCPGEPRLAERLSLIQEGWPQRVRMAHLAMVGSHKINGVSRLHSRILKERLFADFERIFPGRIVNITNGITPRRWLLQANPLLAGLITEAIGPEWVLALSDLKRLAPLVDDPAFRHSWRQIKLENKKRLVRYIRRKVGLEADPNSLFDVHVKRIHEYKRQLLNILNVIALYNRLKDEPREPFASRTVIFAGKAAPAYFQAKLIIKLIHDVARTINGDPVAAGRLQVVFLPNFCVSAAEKIIPAADLSEQISTAGTEASGTGNMKMALNGALTIGTLDGANIEIMEAVGCDNIFTFGLSAEAVDALRADGYSPRVMVERHPELGRVLSMLSDGVFSPQEKGLYAPLLRRLLDEGDPFMVLADYPAYAVTRQNAADLFADIDTWTRRSILNTANMGYFSSDRAVLEYADAIWGVSPLPALSLRH